MTVCASGRSGRARSPVAANPRKRPDSRGAVSKITDPSSREESATTSTTPPLTACCRPAFTVATWAGCTFTREISWPWSFSSAAITSPRRASGSAATSRRMTRRAIASASCTTSASASRAEAGAQVGDFLNRSRQTLDDRLQFRRGPVPAGDLALPRPAAWRFAHLLLISRLQLGYLGRAIAAGL